MFSQKVFYVVCIQMSFKKKSDLIFLRQNQIKKLKLLQITVYFRQRSGRNQNQSQDQFGPKGDQSEGYHMILFLVKVPKSSYLGSQ